jgi:formamidopyrimidine-DNA glycosylase
MTRPREERESIREAVVPELPEVEVTRGRLERELAGREIVQVIIRAPKLRLPVPLELVSLLPGQTVQSVERRGKYLLFDCKCGRLIVHLGMTGFLRIVSGGTPAGKHDHLDVVFADGRLLRFHDPRKFGTIAWTTGDPLEHPLLAGIGPEPLQPGFNGGYLFTASRNRRVPVKQLIMNAAVVAGVGNIYANEALFRSGIRPDRPASSLTAEESARLAAAIRTVLTDSIERGSTYVVAEETVAYHPLEFNVYGRKGEDCSRCGGTLTEIRLGNRSSVYCPVCQM